MGCYCEKWWMILFWVNTGTGYGASCFFCHIYILSPTLNCTLSSFTLPSISDCTWKSKSWDYKVSKPLLLKCIWVQSLILFCVLWKYCLLQCICLQYCLNHLHLFKLYSYVLWLSPYILILSVIMVDEAHERSISTDILLGLLKKVKSFCGLDILEIKVCILPTVEVMFICVNWLWF